MKNQNQKGISSLLGIIIIIVVGVVVVGGVLVYQYWWAPEEGVEIEAPKVEAPKDETADWKVYRNEEYGFEIKYPDRVHVVEFGPEEDWARTGQLAKIWIPTFDGSANPLSAEIQIFKEAVFLGTPTSLNDYSQLYSYIEKWYGVPLHEVETLREAKEKERYIDNRAAIEISYIEIGEDPRQQLPVVIIFSSNNGLLYRIFCGSETGQYCDPMLSTFRFLE